MAECERQNLIRLHRLNSVRKKTPFLQLPSREEAEQRFIQIAWAYEVLSDAGRRRAFDDPRPRPEPGQPSLPDAIEALSPSTSNDENEQRRQKARTFSSNQDI